MRQLVAIKQRRIDETPGATFPSGLKVLYQGDDCIVDIVFVHGLTGDRERTWRHEEEQLPWPEKLLPQKIPNCRVLTFGYDAYVTDLKGLGRMVSTSTVSDHGSSLVMSLGNLRTEDGTSTRPLIFVTHSLGGIVCKEGLCYAARKEGDQRLRMLYSSTCGVLFMGTPHQGSSLAHWAQGIAKTLGFVKQTNKRLLKVLRTDSELLARGNEMFLTMVEDRKAAISPLSPIRISCFFEELPLPLTPGKIVPRASAILLGHAIIGIHGNHRDMARFRELDDCGFLNVVGELKECIRSANMQRRPSRRPLCRRLRFWKSSHLRYHVGPNPRQGALFC
ncbi:hypothetical protein QBC39DRAFT_257317 [Podospora conica]|nr:hypothetical protein QBC39DRAFT_257317 [Schizothecium conicum]